MWDRIYLLNLMATKRGKLKDENVLSFELEDELWKILLNSH